MSLLQALLLQHAWAEHSAVYRVQPSFCVAGRFTNSITSSMRLYYESGVQWPNFMQQYCKVGNIVVISSCVSVPDAFS
jgi:hypothetical protein